MMTIKERQELDREKFMRVDWDWVDEQLRSIGYTTPKSRDTVLALIRVIEDADFSKKQEKDIDKYMEVANFLAKGHPVSPDDPENWQDAVPGELSVRDRVRVRRDAYLGDAGSKNNGKVGRIVSMRNGSIYVVYDGENPETPTIHQIASLQKLV